MGKFVNKTRVLIWIIIALGLLNIATIGTIFWFMKYGEPNKNEFSRHRLGEKFGRNGKHIQNRLFEKLNFNTEQKAKFNKVEKEYRDLAWSKASAMHQLRKNMFTLLNTNNPDMLKVEQVADSIGLLHKELKMQTADFYLKVRAICKPEQADSLARFFERIVSQEPDVPFPQHYRSKKNFKSKGDLAPHRQSSDFDEQLPPPPPPPAN